MGNPKKSPKPAPSELFHITLNLGGNITTAQGATALAALQALPKPAKIMNKATIVMSYGGKKTERFFLPPRLHRIFYSSETMQAIHAKQLAMGLK